MLSFANYSNFLNYIFGNIKRENSTRSITIKMKKSRMLKRAKKRKKSCLNIAKYGWNGLKMKGKAIYILTSIKKHFKQGIKNVNALLFLLHITLTFLSPLPSPSKLTFCFLRPEMMRSE